MTSGLPTRPDHSTDLIPLFERAIADVREEVADSPYLKEALRVIPAGGYRSAIGSFWNAVVDDLRNKIIHRSLALFNKALSLGREIRTYEDFQDHVTDDQLIDGAYKIGVIGWEAARVLRHAKETRHIFDGHPRSSEPSILKVLAMLEDCAKYVLKQPYPPSVVDIDDYIASMDSSDYDRNEVAIVNALGELPEVYKGELVHRLFTSYIHEKASSTLRSSIEFAAPILWQVLPKGIKLEVVRRVDTVLSEGSLARTELAFDFVRVVEANRYLSLTARRYKIAPLVTELATAVPQTLTGFEVEAEVGRWLTADRAA